MRSRRGNDSLAMPRHRRLKTVSPRAIGICASLVTAGLLFGGCMLGPKFMRPEVLTAAEWREMATEQYIGEPVDTVDWWKKLNDPVLDSLIAEAFEQNLTLQTAALRIVQARVGRAATGWTQFPALTGGASASESRRSLTVTPDVEVDASVTRPAPRALGPIGTEVANQLRRDIAATEVDVDVNVARDIDLYDVSFDAVWELDIWGAKRQRVRAAKNEVAAAFATYDDVMVSLAGEVARTYLQIRSLDQRIDAMNELLKTMNEFSDMTKERYENGDALVTDVRLAELLSGIVGASLPKLENSRRQSENALCVLLGLAPQDLRDRLGATTGLPEIPITSIVGVPADLLRRRPDVRMAEYLAAAQCARVGAAKADILPSFVLFGGAGYKSSNTETLFRSDSVSTVYGAMTSVTGILSYPFTVQNVRLQDARFMETMLRYQDTVLRANMEVENNMFAFLKAQEEVELLKLNVVNAQETAKLTMGAYKEGKVIVSVPLVALTFLASQQDQMLEWRGETATRYVAIYKSLGGGWESRVDQELLPEYIQEQMKKQADWWSFWGGRALSTQEVRQEKS